MREPIPKPDKKKKKKIKTPTPEGPRECIHCKTTVGLSIHHVYNKDARDWSSKHKAVEWVCYPDHQGSKGIHGTHSDGKLNKYLKQKWQRILEGKGMTRKEFRAGACKNYLED